MISDNNQTLTSSSSKKPSLIENLSAKFEHLITSLPFFAKNQPLAGIDISSTAVKLVVLGRNRSKYTIKNYAVVKLPSGAVSEKTIHQPDAVAEAIKHAIVESGCKVTNAAIAMPNADVISKTIQMEANLSERELEGLVEFEAEKYIHHPMENVSLDFHSMGKVVWNPEQINVLLVATLTTKIADRVALASKADINVSVVDVESNVMTNAVSLLMKQVPEHLSSGVIAVFDIGATTTTVNIMQNNVSLYSHEEAFGTAQLTTALQEEAGLSFEAAQDLQISRGLTGFQFAKILHTYQESLLAQLQAILQLFFSAGEYNKVDYILVSGGGSVLPDLSTFLADKLLTPVEIANPIKGMAIASQIDVDLLQRDAPVLMLALGLALRGFDI